jgi:RimK family alpha-L-glutamate ligase
MRKIYVKTFETFNLNEENDFSNLGLNSNMPSDKAVLFLNWNYEIEDKNGKKYNIGELIEKHFKNSEFSKLENIHFLDGEIYNKTTKLSDYSFVFIGTVGDSYENLILVEDYCKTHNIPTLAYGANTFENNKFRQLQELAKAGIKIPKTYTFNSGKTCDIEFVESNFTYPLVLKPAHGSKGRGVQIIKNNSEFKKALNSIKEEILMIQEFLPNDCDYRIYFIGDKHAFTARRSSTDEKEFRNNISLGGKSKFVNLNYNQMQIAKKAHECMGFYVSGVDLIENKETGEWYVLEVNSAPQFSGFGDKKFCEDIIQIFADSINRLKK